MGASCPSAQLALPPIRPRAASYDPASVAPPRDAPVAVHVQLPQPGQAPQPLERADPVLRQPQALERAASRQALDAGDALHAWGRCARHGRAGGRAIRRLVVGAGLGPGVGMRVGRAAPTACALHACACVHMRARWVARLADELERLQGWEHVQREHLQELCGEVACAALVSCMPARPVRVQLQARSQHAVTSNSAMHPKGWRDRHATADAAALRTLGYSCRNSSSCVTPARAAAPPSKHTSSSPFASTIASIAVRHRSVQRAAGTHSGRRGQRAGRRQAASGSAPQRSAPTPQPARTTMPRLHLPSLPPTKWIAPYRILCMYSSHSRDRR